MLSVLWTCLWIAAAEPLAGDPLEWSFGAAAATEVHDDYRQRLEALERAYAAGRDATRSAFSEALKEAEREAQETVAGTSGKRQVQATRELRRVQDTGKLLREKSAPALPVAQLESTWVDPRRRTRWLFFPGKKPRAEMRHQESGELIAEGTWEWRGESRTFLCRFGEARPYEARKGFFIVVFPEKLTGKAVAQIHWQQRRHSRDSGELIPERFDDRNLQKAWGAYTKEVAKLRKTYLDERADAQDQLHTHLKQARKEILGRASEIQSTHLEEVDRALEWFARRPVPLARQLTGVQWNYVGKSKAHWVFGKKGKLNYNEGTNHAQGEWLIIDEDSVVGMLGGFYLVTFDLRGRRAHAVGFDRGLGRFDRHLVPAGK